VRLTDLVGITSGAGVAAVTALALGGFAVANRIERRVPSAVEGPVSSNVKGGALAIVAALAAIGAGVVDRGTMKLGFISAPELAGRIMRGDRDLGLFDLRPPTAFEQFHIPTARRATADDFAAIALAPQTNVVLYADARAALLDAVRVLRGRNHREVHVLREGIFEWLARVQEPRLAVDATPAERVEFERAAEMSRFFGGVPRAGVSREEVPLGYWTGAVRSEELLMAAAVQSVTAVRRRGC
jgi:rhodanese-related sulfurtransferase